tara:strand:- start:745 stop:942 length:198 start_codon:yes stop_codon:yes gene_type:complete
MENTMTKKIIEHKHTIDRKLFVLLTLLVIGVFAKEFGGIVAPDAMAELSSYSTLNLHHSGSVRVK